MAGAVWIIGGGRADLDRRQPPVTVRVLRREAHGPGAIRLASSTRHRAAAPAGSVVAGTGPAQHSGEKWYAQIKEAFPDDEVITEQDRQQKAGNTQEEAELSQALTAADQA